MGYYTNYQLEYKAELEIEEAIKEWIHQKEGTRYAIEECQETKWYSWEKDMVELSLRFPSVSFTLRGQGEENEDMWIAHFKNGKSHIRKAIISFEPFDEATLK